MLKNVKIYSSFSVQDLELAKEFYEKTLSLEVNQRTEGLDLKINDENTVFIYFSPQNKPADFTILNFVVDDVEAVVDQLLAKGVTMEHYDMPGIKTDEKGIARQEREEIGPRVMAWFKDPAGNILALSQRTK